MSVVIPAYNMEPLVGDAIRSAQRQTWRNVEVIVVDDGSTDGTRAVAEAIAAEDPRVRVVHEENGGLSSARNAGLAVAKGEFICFLDADDMLLPDKIERQVAFLNLFHSCDLVYSDYYIGDNRLTPTFLMSVQPPAMAMRDVLPYRNCFAPMSPLMRSALVAKTGTFDVALKSCEDWDYWIRAADICAFAYLPGPVGVYRTHPGQMHNDRMRMRDNQEKVITKHFPYKSQRWRVAHASIAWADAQRASAERRPLAFIVKMFQMMWHSRSLAALRRTVQLARYG